MTRKRKGRTTVSLVISMNSMRGLSPTPGAVAVFTFAREASRAPVLSRGDWSRCHTARLAVDSASLGTRAPRQG